MADTSSAVTTVSESRTPESTLLDQLEQMSHSRAGRFGVRINLSKLRPHNRQPHHIRISSRSLDSILNSADARLFILSNDDIFLLCRDARVEDVDYVVDKLRMMFQNDPLAHRRPGQTEDGFTSWFDLEIDYDLLLDEVRNMEAAAKRSRARREDASAGQGQGASFAGEPLDPFSLAQIDEALQRARISNLVNEQAAVIIGADGTERILFRELFVSMGQLQQLLARGYNIFANTWLFQHLTETVDKRMISHLLRENFGELATPISVNFNIKTVLSRDFQRLDNHIAEFTDNVVIELQQIDVFSDIEGYLEARTWLKDRGYRVLLDGLNPMSLQHFNPGLLDADYYKVAWGTEFTETESSDAHSMTAKLVKEIGAKHFILARTDSEDAVAWALSLGIRRFQGYFMDRLVQKQIEKEGGLAGDKGVAKRPARAAKAKRS